MLTNIRTDLFRVYEPVATLRSYDEIEFPKLQSPSFGFIEKVEENSEEKPSSTLTSLVVPDPRTQTSTNSPYKSTIIVDKKTLNMEYYDDLGNLKFKSRVSTGKNSGLKQKVGDMRTPEGTFTISGFENRTDKYARDNFGKQPWVYRLNTPGWTGILFHGDANEPDKIGTPASKGCIRLPNDKLEELHNILGEDNNALNKLKVIIKKQGGNMKLVSKNPVQRFKLGRRILYAEPGAPLPTLKLRGKINNLNWNQSWKNRNTDNDFEAELKRYNETLGANKFNLKDTKGFQNLLRKYSEEVGQSLGNYDKFSDGKWGTESQSYYDLLASEFKNKQKPISQAQPVAPQKPTLQQMRRDYNGLGTFFSKQHAVRDLGFNDYSSMVDYVNKNANSAFSQAMRARFGNDTRDWNIADVEGALGVHGKYRRGRFGDFADIQRNLGSWVGTQSGKLANMTEEQWNPKPLPAQTISQVNTQPQSNFTNFANFYTNNMNQLLNNYNNWKQQLSWYRPQVQEVTNDFTPKKSNNINVYKDRFGGMYYDPNFLTQEERLISKDPVKLFKLGGRVQKYLLGKILDVAAAMGIPGAAFISGIKHLRDVVNKKKQATKEARKYLSDTLINNPFIKTVPAINIPTEIGKAVSKTSPTKTVIPELVLMAKLKKEAEEKQKLRNKIKMSEVRPNSISLTTPFASDYKITGNKVYARTHPYDPETGYVIDKDIPYLELGRDTVFLDEEGNLRINDGKATRISGRQLSNGQIMLSNGRLIGERNADGSNYFDQLAAAAGYNSRQEVMELLKQLKKLGLYKGKIDGLFGRQTAQAYSNYHVK